MPTVASRYGRPGYGYGALANGCKNVRPFRETSEGDANAPPAMQRKSDRRINFSYSYENLASRTSTLRYKTLRRACGTSEAKGGLGLWLGAPLPLPSCSCCP